TSLSQIDEVVGRCRLELQTSTVSRYLGCLRTGPAYLFVRVRHYPSHFERIGCEPEQVRGERLVSVEAAARNPSTLLETPFIDCSEVRARVCDHHIRSGDDELRRRGHDHQSEPTLVCVGLDGELRGGSWRRW